MTLIAMQKGAFDLSALLDTDKAISEYLYQVLSEGDTDELIRAVGYVAKARGMAQIAKTRGSVVQVFAKPSHQGQNLVLIRW